MPQGSDVVDRTVVEQNPKRRDRRTYALIGMTTAFALTAIAIAFMVARDAMYDRAHEDTADATIETNIYQVGAQIPGKITEVLVQDNQSVKKGDVLARLDESEVRLAARQAEAALTLAREQAEAARMQIVQIRNFSANRGSANEEQNAQAKAAAQAAAAEMAQVKQAQEAAAQQLAHAQKRLAEVQAAYRPIAAHASAGVLPAISVHQAQMTLEMAQMQRDNAQNAVKMLQAKAAQLKQISKQSASAGPRQAARVDGGVIQDQLKAARSQHAQLTAQVRQAEIAVEAARRAAKSAAIVSPVDGVVARKLVSPDMRVQPGQPLVAIVQKGPIWVTANFDEKQIARIKLGQAAYVRVASNPDNVIAGRVAGISPAAILKTPPAAAPGVQEQQTTQKAANVQPATAKKDEAVKEAPKQAAPQPIARTVPVRIEFDPAFQPQSKAVVLPGMSAHVSVKVD